MTVTDNKLIFFLIGILVYKCYPRFHLVAIRKMKHMSSLYSKSYREIRSADEDQVYPFRICRCYTLSINCRITIRWYIGVVEVFIFTLHKYLFSPAGKEVIWNEFHPQLRHFMEYLGRLKCGVGIQILEHTGYNTGTLRYLRAIQISADTIHTFHINSIMSRFHVVSHDKDLLSRLQANILEGFLTYPVPIVDNNPFHFFFRKRLTQPFPYLCRFRRGKNQHIGIFVFGEDMGNKRRYHVVIPHDDIMPRLQVMYLSLLMILYPTFNRVCYNGNNCSIEYEGADDKGDSAY